MGAVRYESMTRVGAALQKRTTEANVMSLVSETGLPVERVAKALGALLERDLVTSRDGPRGPFRWKPGANLPVSKGKDGGGTKDVEGLLKARLAKHTAKADEAKAAMMHHDREAKKISAALKALANV